MTVCLVLGGELLGIHALSATRPPETTLFVVSDDTHLSERQLPDEIHLISGTPSSKETLSQLSFVPDEILLNEATDEKMRATSRTVEAVFPTIPRVRTVVHPEGKAEPPASQSRDRADFFETILTRTAPVADRIENVLANERAPELCRTLRSIDGTVAIVMHDNPDPDAIASAVTLAYIAESFDCETQIGYYGEISHQENRAFVNVLDLDLNRFDAETDLDTFGGFALVDHSRPGVNDGLPSSLDVDIVIDHHPPRAPIDATYRDLRHGVGATSTLLVDYLQRYNLALPETVATALLFGIRVDTNEFRREVSPADFEAAAYLMERADLDVLGRIDQPRMSTHTLEIIGRAIENKTQDGSVLVSCVDNIEDRDALAQAADRLLSIQNIDATVVYGVDGETIYLSARASTDEIDIGEVVRDALDQIGSAGGHAEMAGAQVQLGAIKDLSPEDTPLLERVRNVINGRFFEALEARQTHLLTTASPSDAYRFDERTGFDDGPTG